ncbi:stage II sporulation protein M, partial [bacterium]|nr:stage II sporulation protein M [bacterium]
PFHYTELAATADSYADCRRRFLAAFAAGAIVGMMPRWQIAPYLPPQEEFSNAAGFLNTFLNTSTQSETLLFIFTQNTRVLLAALILATFTFGVAALVLTPLTFVILGYITSQVLIAGYTPALLVGAVLTHGVVEIPMIVLATAVALHLGAVVTKPPRRETVGHAWTVAVADTFKVSLGVLLPGLLLAAFLESYLTPRIVLLVLGGS